MAYSDEDKTGIFNFICSEIEKGNSLREVLRHHDNMPSTQTFYKWIDSDSEKSKQYARSCEVRADILFDEIIEIADDTSNDSVYTENGEKVNSEWINRSRLRVDARKWILSKMNPKKYGDKTDITTNGKEINIPFIEWVRNDGKD